MSASFFGFMCGFVAGVKNVNGTHSIMVLIAYVVMIIPLTALALTLSGIFRIHKLYKWKYTPVKTFARAFEAEICSRGAQQAQVVDDDQVINTFTLGIDLFPEDSLLKTCYALYLLEKNNDFALLTLTLERLRQIRVPIDVKFMIFCLEKERLNIALAQDGGVEEIHSKLLGVKKHSNRAKMWMKRFWDMLLKEEDLHSLPDVVANMDTEEHKAEAILTKLREKFPRNVVILRHYAVFLERIKNDPDAAQIALRMADDMEEEKTTKHRKRTTKKEKDKSQSKIVPMPSASSSSAKFIEIKEADSDNHSIVRFSEGGRGGSDDEGDPVRLPHSVSYAADNDTAPYPLSISESYSNQIRHIEPEHTARTDDDKASAASGSSISFTQLKSMKRSDVLRHRKYKYLTENSRSKALSRLTVAINVTLLLLLANIVAVFATTEYMISTFDASITDVQGASNAKVLLHEGALYPTFVFLLKYLIINTQKMRFGLLLDNMTYLESNRAELTDNLNNLESIITSLFSAHTNYKRLTEGWKDVKYSIYEWDIATQTNNPINENLWDSLSEFIWRAREISTVDESQLLELNQSMPLRYILDNAPNGIYDALTDLVSLYQDRNNGVALDLTVVVAVLIPITFSILALLGVALLFPAVREIKLERAATLRLFLSVPKSSISGIVNRLRSEEELAGEDIISEVSEISNIELKEEFLQYNTQAMPVLRSFVIKYLVSLVLVFAAICVIAFTSLFSLVSITDYVAEIAVSSQERVLGTRLQFDTYNLAFSNFDQLYTGPFRTNIVNDSADFDAIDVELRFGDSKLSLPGGFNYVPFLLDIDFGRSCPELSIYNLSCTGYVSLIDLMRDEALSMLNFNDSQINLNATQITIMNFIEELYFDPWSDELADFFVGRARKELHRIDTIVIILFILLLPSLLVILLVLRPIVKRIRLESTRTVKMMLMVPFEVIDSLHPVRDFLNTGQHNFKQKQIAGGADSSNDDLMRMVFMENNRAIAITSPLGEIDVFNPHAERLFGYSKKEVFGHNLSFLLADASAISTHNNALMNLRNHKPEVKDEKEKKEVQKEEHIEIYGRHKSSELVPLRLTMVQAKVNGKVFIVHYVDDISHIRQFEADAVKQQQAFNFEKNKMESFMYNMYPKSIAEQLMIANDSNSNNQHLLAEEYKEVTILFADIVGFTTMCSHLEPAALLIILNGIFLKWDALVEKFGLQKIKTIGDCYMVAGGLPERTIDHAEKTLEFAMEMIEALNTYNRSNEFLMSRGLTLSLRVGINTGPVVAGIIGNTRSCFDLWGDAVNVASRMESTSLEGRIQVSQTTFNQSKINFDFEERGTVDVKGKGVMLTYLLVGKRFQNTPGGTIRDMRFMKHQTPNKIPSKLLLTTASHDLTAISPTTPSPSFFSNNNNSHPLPLPNNNTTTTNTTTTNVTNATNNNNTSHPHPPASASSSSNSNSNNNA